MKVATVEKTLDGLDYKIVFRKVAAPADLPEAVDSTSDKEVDRCLHR